MSVYIDGKKRGRCGARIRVQKLDRGDDISRFLSTSTLQYIMGKKSGTTYLV